MAQADVGNGVAKFLGVKFKSKDALISSEHASGRDQDVDMV